jgi:glutamine cyclotransferase
MSDGSDTLFIRSRSFALQKKIPVTVNGKPLKNINELEYAHNRVFANVWYSNFIFEINSLNGKVMKIIDCNQIVQKAKTRSDDEVLNGIAFNPKTGTFYITGKNWQYMFEVTW